MEAIAIVGIDLGKRTFHVHGQSRSGHPLLKKMFNRSQLVLFMARLPACRVVMEACAGAHWFARKFAAMGHSPQLIAPQYVRPFVKTNKHDFADAEAICEAACRPTMRFVAPKNVDQQCLGVLHRLRESWVAERTAMINQVHGFLLEFGVTATPGKTLISKLPELIERPELELPPALQSLLLQLAERFHALQEQIQSIDQQINDRLKQDEAAQRLLSIPGIGPVTASLIASEVGNARQFANSRDFAASLGLVPRQHSTGGRSNLLGISKRGDKHLRRLLVQGARAIMMRADKRNDALGVWIKQMLTRRHSNVVACALANKMARIVWAVLAKKTTFQSYPVAMAA
jgi:transposase